MTDVRLALAERNETPAPGAPKDVPSVRSEERSAESDD